MTSSVLIFQNQPENDRTMSWREGDIYMELATLVVGAAFSTPAGWCG